MAKINRAVRIEKKFSSTEVIGVPTMSVRTPFNRDASAVSRENTAVPAQMGTRIRPTAIDSYFNSLFIMVNTSF